MSDFDQMQSLMARQAIRSLIEQYALTTPSFEQMSSAVDAAVAAYVRMLAAGRIDTHVVVLSGKDLREQLAEQGLEHDRFMELIKLFMSVGYYAGFFGIYIDASLAANREDGSGGVTPLPGLHR